MIKSENNKINIILKCYSLNLTYIECYFEKDKIFNINEKYYFYYKKLNNSNITLNNHNILIDNQRISFLFKPNIYKKQILYYNNRKIYVKANKEMINNGYLFILRKSKKILNRPKDGFNKYIELNNLISHAGLSGYRPQSTLIAYKEAIRRGYRIVDGDLQFTKDKIPIINKEEVLDKISNGKGLLSTKTLKELEKLDFGNNEFKGQKILKLEDLLKLCKKHDIILDLDLGHAPFHKYFNKSNEYYNILINIIKKYNMFNSIIFNSGNNLLTISKLYLIKNDIAISIAGMNKIKNIKKIETQFNSSKRLIYNFGGLLNGKKIDETSVHYALKTGKKVKAAKVNNKIISDKIVNWGVNYITTQYLHPFLIRNNKEYPIKIKCISKANSKFSECQINSNIILKDNEEYNIYYMDNINNTYETINEKPIGKFKYNK
jgi:glycerophosphoryl diester phosphodiesterase